VARTKGAYRQHDLELATRAFKRAGFPPHRARIRHDDVVIYFTKDIEDDAFERGDNDDNQNNEWDTYLDAAEAGKK
jgi:hypothetical protein